MSLRIGFDLDGVLADMDREIARQAEILFGQHADGGQYREECPGGEVHDGHVPTRLALTIRQQQQLWRKVSSIENFWETLEEVEDGAIGRIAELTRSRRWEPIFLTSRPASAGDTTQSQTQRWLQAKGFRLPSVYVVKGSRGLIAASLELDVVVDDRVENCMDVVADSKARPILVWRHGGTSLPGGVKRLRIPVVCSMSECLDTLDRFEHTHEKSWSFDRVRRLLGFKEPALD